MILEETMEKVRGKRFPVNANDYKLYEEVGKGVSATVYRAFCIPFNKKVAIKVIDLEKCNNNLDGIRREVRTMTLIDHPNVLRAHCSFNTGHNLWVVMPYMAKGSCLHIMKSAYPEGFEEPVIATVLREVLKALVYLHAHGHIHRDLKAGNILIDSNGAVKLADFGVSACMFDAGDSQRRRNTFVGTPCWMAPEVMQQLHGYDFKADIWSFGITALELAHGHAPFSKYPPMKVLLMTLQNSPPCLNYERDKRFSKLFKEMIASCLVKDPKKRPSSVKLLKHKFFKHARSNDYLTHTILDGLLPLSDRFRMLKANEADLLLQKDVIYGDKEQLSEPEYIPGINAWNFNLNDVRNQDAIIWDFDGISDAEYPNVSDTLVDKPDNICLPMDRISSNRVNNSNAAVHPEDGINDINNLESSPVFPIQPCQSLRDCFDVCEEELGDGNPSWSYAIQSDSEWQGELQSPARALYQDLRSDDNNLRQSCSLPRSVVPGFKKKLSGSLRQDNVCPSREVIGDGDREYLQPRYQPERNDNGLLCLQKKDINNHTSVADASEGEVVQGKCCFKVTSSDLIPKDPDDCSNNVIFGDPAGSTILSCSAAPFLPALRYILQQNTMQRQEISKLIKYAEQTRGNSMFSMRGTNDISPILPSSARERKLQSQVIQLQHSNRSLTEELQSQRMKNARLEMKLSALVKKGKI